MTTLALNERTAINHGRPSGSKRRSAGFSLIELMIAVVAVAILASIAYPSYVAYVQRAKRAEGRAALMQAANALERFYTANNTYTTDLTAAQFRAFSGSSATTSAYNLTVVAGPTGSISSSFTVRATPTFSDPKCTRLDLSSTGTKAANGTGGVNECWNR
jgi:type IV pilus assembly protein PilE